MAKRRCAACGCLFVPRRNVPQLRYCSKRATPSIDVETVSATLWLASGFRTLSVNSAENRQRRW